MELEKARHWVSRELGIYCECRCFSFVESAVVRVIRIFDGFAPKRIPNGELSIAFVSLQKLRSLHRQYLGDASFTDVMTFLGDAKMSFAGEIVIAPAFALRQLALRCTTFSEEVTLYLVHGYLHLCGFDDVQPYDRIKMKRAERTYMQLLQKHAAVPQFFWCSARQTL
jgi:probable rRNA maturation factor